MSTLWNKGVKAEDAVEKFTVGNDRELDARLAPFDIEGSLAHIAMLESIGLLEKQELEILTAELRKLQEEGVALEPDVEDIHSQIELLLTRRVGDIGKKIHSGRSRNDQVLVDLKLYFKHEIGLIRQDIERIFVLLQTLSERHAKTPMPGYTHTQIAMPSSFGLWFGAYAEALADDMHMLTAALCITDSNPLGSAAGYGSTLPLDRAMTTRLLGFATQNFNPIAAQMSRGKAERALAAALAAFATTLGQLADDCTHFMNGNYGFISFPDELTTGSSIMPHKKNPDVWEIVRARCNRLRSVPNELAMLAGNMTHGYHRDYQLAKDILFPAIDSFHEFSRMVELMLSNVHVREDILDDPRYDTLYTVEEVNRRVLAGMTFRDAYIAVGREVADGTWHAVRTAPAVELHNERIKEKFSTLCQCCKKSDK